MEFLLELFFFQTPHKWTPGGLIISCSDISITHHCKHKKARVFSESKVTKWKVRNLEKRKKERLVGWFLSFKVLDQLHHTTDVNSKTLKQQSPLPAQHVVFFWSADRNVAILSSNHKSLLVAKPDCKAGCNLITSSAAGMRHNFFFSFSYKFMT